MRRSADDPAGRVGRPCIDARSHQCRVAGPHRVVIVSPEGGLPTGSRALEVGDLGPAAPSLRVPAMAFQPGILISLCGVGRRDPPQAILEGPRVGQVHLGRGESRVRQVHVGIGQPRERDEIRRQTEAPGRRPGQVIEVSPAPGSSDAASGDADRLDHPEP